MKANTKNALRKVRPLLAAVRLTRRYRFELQDAWRRATLDYQAQVNKERLISQRAETLKTYLNASRVRKLHLGAGPVILPGWLNTDLSPVDDRSIFLDAREKFPFPDDTWDYIFSEHLIEHLGYYDGAEMLRECFRTLRPGGKLRIATPDIERIIGLYSYPHTDIQKTYIAQATELTAFNGLPAHECFVVNNFFRDWGHQTVYDIRVLTDSVSKAGFPEITTWAPGQSKDANLQGIESHDKSIGDLMNVYETMILEATKP